MNHLESAIFIFSFIFSYLVYLFDYSSYYELYYSFYFPIVPLNSHLIFVFIVF